MTTPVDQVRHEFNRIASVSSSQGDLPYVYDEWLLNLVPIGCQGVLELGCGMGRFTRALARRVRHVTALDLSPEMLRVARQRSTEYSNIKYRIGNILDEGNTLGTHQCVVSLATLHHLPLAPAADVMKAAVAPGGLLIVHDLRRSAGMADRASDAVRLAIKAAWVWTHRGRARVPREERDAWVAHGRGDVYLTAREACQLRDDYFPGATLTQHFLWRYTLVWNKSHAA